MNEATKKQPLDKVLAQKFINPDTDREVTVASALGYEKNKKASYEEMEPKEEETAALNLNRNLALEIFL